MGIAQEIKERLDIVEIIQEYFPLQKTGSSYKALCPFHKEKTPSFMVSPSKQIWKCFGCGRGGDVFKFIQEIEGVDFSGALKILAEKAGVDLKRYRTKPKDSHTSKVLEALEEATRYYQKNLKKNLKALEYLKKRKLKDETIEIFRLGYSPSWEGSILYLKNKGFSEKEILDTGIAVKKEDGSLYDRFKGRIIFPIQNLFGQVIGFGGRILQEKSDVAKYINVPQTIVYNKSKVLYGIDKAKVAIREKGYVILVEGYMDVISSHQAGVKNVVSCSGTALTEEQLKILSRYTKTLVLCFDFDPAGIKAFLRGIELGWQYGFEIKVIKLEKGKDPDEIARKNPLEWQKISQNLVSFLDYLIEIIKNTNLDDLENKKRAASKMAEILSKLKDPVEKAHYISKLSKILDLKEEVIWDLILKYKKDEKNLEEAEIILPKKDKVELAFEKIFSIILNYPELIKEYNIFSLPVLESKKLLNLSVFKLYLLLKNFYNNHNYIDIEEFKLSLNEENQRELEIYFLLFDKEYSHLNFEQIKEDFIKLYKILQQELLKERISEILKLLRIAESEKNIEQVNEYLKELSSLNKKLSKFRSI